MWHWATEERAKIVVKDIFPKRERQWKKKNLTDVDAGKSKADNRIKWCSCKK